MSRSDTPMPSAAVRWETHVWLSCGCGGNYTLSKEPAIGDLLWCYWHDGKAKVTRFRAVKQEINDA